MLFYASRDKTRIVPADDPEAGYVVNPEQPGEFAAVLHQHQQEEQARQQAAADARDREAASTKAQAPDEDKAGGPARRRG